MSARNDIRNSDNIQHCISTIACMTKRGLIIAKPQDVTNRSRRFPI